MSVFIQQAREDLDPANLDFIREEERGIWATPADQLFVDGAIPTQCRFSRADTAQC